jgi:hypothetical protein
MTRLQGTIQVDSTVDHGSTFRLTFRLPSGNPGSRIAPASIQPAFLKPEEAS